MIRLSTLVEPFEQPLLAHYGDRLLAEHLQALAALKTCRTALSPRLEAHGPACEARGFVPHSCGHQLCPHCQHHESQQWLERQIKALVPGNYFLLTFTLPAEFRVLAFAHQRVVYGALMSAAWQTVQSFSQQDRHLQGTPGAIAVRHTHSRRLDFHPHVHLVMPAAALDREQRLWRTKAGKRYLFPHKALAKVFRAKMLDALSTAGLPLPVCHPVRWVVDCKHVGSGEKALVYLGRYLYRGVLQEKDILACADGRVTFRYRNAKTRRSEARTLSGADFLWLLLQHALPKGLRRARNFGFLHPNSKRLLELLRLLLKFAPARAVAWIRPRAALTCPGCGGDIMILRTRIRPLPQGSDPTDVAAGALAM